jgi:hypothetical protein
MDAVASVLWEEYKDTIKLTLLIILIGVLGILVGCDGWAKLTVGKQEGYLIISSDTSKSNFEVNKS